MKHTFDGTTAYCRGCGLALEDYFDEGRRHSLCPDNDPRPHLMALQRMQHLIEPIMADMGFVSIETVH